MPAERAPPAIPESRIAAKLFRALLLAPGRDQHYSHAFALIQYPALQDVAGSW